MGAQMVVKISASDYISELSDYRNYPIARVTRHRALAVSSRIAPTSGFSVERARVQTISRAVFARTMGRKLTSKWVNGSRATERYGARSGISSPRARLSFSDRKGGPREASASKVWRKCEKASGAICTIEIRRFRRARSRSRSIRTGSRKLSRVSSRSPPLPLRKCKRRSRYRVSNAGRFFTKM